MKIIIAFALTICLFGCKEKEPIVSGPPYGIVGTYKGVSTTPATIFKDLLSNYDTFKETTTDVISQTGTDTYRIQIKTIGEARKGASSPVNYEFSAELAGGKINAYTAQLRYGFIGNYSTMIPSTTQLDKGPKFTECEVIPIGTNLEVRTSIHYKLDRGSIVESTLIKLK